jgi:fatty-acyl-CoA synthase
MKEYMGFDAAMSRQLLVGEIVARNARKFPDREILIFGERRITCRELEERVNRLANAMLSQGIRKDDKVGILTLNCAEEVEIFFAAAKIGAVNVPINHRLSPREIAYILNNAEAKILFVGSGFVNVLDKMRGDFPLIKEIVGIGQKEGEAYPDYEKVLASGSPIRPEVWLQDEDDAFIVYTSGTTGRAKGAVLTHKNIIAHSMTLDIEALDSLPRRPDLPRPTQKRWLSIVPLFHVAGVTGTIKNILTTTLTVVRDFDPVGLLSTIQKEGITGMFLAPAMWLMVISHPDFKKYDVSSLRVASYGAAPMPNALKERVLEAFPNAGLSENFGQTEMSPTVVYMKNQDALRKEGSVGYPLFNVEVRIVDHNMNDVPVGAIGEAVYRGPSLFKGYYKNPEANKEAFEGGWFHSGDLVRRDEEGFIYVVDRKKDMIISGGENIYSAEVEAVLYNHPSIQEAAVIGIPDPKWGEAVKAFVVLRSGKEATAEEIIDFCGENLARFKRPKSVEFIPALPRSAAGKVLKNELRSMA